MTGLATVNFIHEAKTGDTVWHLDGHRNAYVDGEYVGRGVWNLEQVKEETRRSLKVHYSKFDRKTGSQMATGGFSASHMILGQKEYDALMWMTTHSRKIIAAVEHCRDIDKLRQIAEIVGYVG